jgi:thioesterase domain-containing protein
MERALTHRKTQENLLEKTIERREKREASASRRQLKAAALEERKQIRFEKAIFRKEFKTMFARFRRLTKCTFDKWHHRHVLFTYKDEQWSIAFEKWHSEGSGSDGYDMDGTHWALHKWCGGWEGRPHPIVDSMNVKHGKDYSEEVIRMLKESKDHPERF